MDYRIEPHDDVAFTEAIEREGGWLRGPGEVARRFHCFPDGHFAAVTPAGERIGACNIVTYPQDHRAWVGGMFVKDHARGHGVARALLHACHAYATAKGVDTIGLDATEMGYGLYDSEGYERIGTCVRWSRPAAVPPPSHTPTAAVFPFSHSELSEVSRYDAPRFGADRSRWLAHILTDNPGRSFVAYDRARGDLMGFVCAQEAFIGPLVAESAEVADSLMHAAEAAGAVPKIHFLEDFAAAMRVVKVRNYRPEPATTVRMVWGKPWPWRPQTLFAQGAWALG